MTTKQRREKAERRQIEVRRRVNEIGAKAEPTNEERSELETLRTESGTLDTELLAVMDAEATEAEARADAGGEGAERRELRGRARVAGYFGGAVSGQPVAGAEAEYAAAMGCPGMMPITMIGPTAEQRAAEHRRRIEERAVTPAPADADVPHTHASIVPALFDRSIAPFLGVEMPVVQTGVQSYPVLSTSLTGGMKGESAAAAETAGAYTVTDADPRRLTGASRIRKEDIAKLPNLEESLRENLSAVLSDALDGQLANGSNADGQLNGLLLQLGDPADPAANAEDFARYVAAFADHVDGLFATMPRDVRALVGPHTLRHMVSTFATNEDATSAYSYLSREFGGVRATRRIADPAANIQQAIIRRANPAGDRVAVAPVWMGLELLRDPYTAADKGEIIVTGTALVGGVVLLRSGAFVQDSFRLA